MKFHFPCFALCEIWAYDPDEDPEMETVSITIHGFFPDHLSAERFRDDREAKLLAKHEAHYRRWPFMSVPTYAASIYEIIPLNDMVFKYISDIETVLEQADRKSVV